jgi:hypothetical protein
MWSYQVYPKTEHKLFIISFNDEIRGTIRVESNAQEVAALKAMEALILNHNESQRSDSE